MAGRDPFQRQWMKTPTYLLDKPHFARLTFWQQGVFWATALYSLKNSQIPGWLLDRHGEVLTDEDIAYGINARTDEAGQLVKAALQALREARLMTWSRGRGWEFAPELYDDMLAECNLVAKRQAAAKRSRNYRARKKQAVEPDLGRLVDLQKAREQQ